MARKNAGLPIGKVVQFNAHDMLVSTNRQISGPGYDGLEQALTRLRGTTFQTTIKTGGEVNTRVFGMIESADVIRKEPITGRMMAIEIDAWNSLSLDEEPIVRLILDGTVVRVRQAGLVAGRTSFLTVCNGLAEYFVFWGHDAKAGG